MYKGSALWIEHYAILFFGLQKLYETWINLNNNSVPQTLSKSYKIFSNKVPKLLENNFYNFETKNIRLLEIKA